MSNKARNGKQSVASMNRRQSHADREMAYLGKAWRLGFDGPSENPQTTTFWDKIHGRLRSIPPEMDSERVITLHTKWLRVKARDRYSGMVLLYHYRDGYSNFTDREVLDALDLFSWA